MTRHAVALLVIFSLIAGVTAPDAAGDAKEAAVKKDLQAFKGIWRLISRQVDGKKIGEEEFKDLILNHDGAGRFSVRHGGKVIVEATVTLDPTTKPRAIDVAFTAGENKGMTVLGIYEINGDTFRVCHARSGAEWPTDFSARAGSGHVLISYKREQK
jgi:uncharacterized protein (TIGR03067 family)